MIVSDLNKDQILWLYYLVNLDTPCGIIHNDNDKIIWVNNCSTLKAGMTTTHTHIDKKRLVTLKQLIKELPATSFQDKDRAYLNFTYRLLSSGIVVEVVDRFYRLDINNQTFRIFEQIEERLI